MTAMTQASRKLVSKFVVIVPPVALSALLGALNVPLAPRLVLCAAVAMILIAGVSLWQRRYE